MTDLSGWAVFFVIGAMIVLAVFLAMFGRNW